MKVIKVIYSNETKFILDIISNLTIKCALEFYNVSNYKEKKKALPIMTRHGTDNVPLIVFADENLEEYNAIWSEQNPDWHKKLIAILDE